MESVRSKLWPVISLWAVVIIGIRVSYLLQNIPVIQANLGTITAALLVYPPVLMSFRTREPITYWRLDRSIFKALALFALISVIVFPVSALVNNGYQSVAFGLSYHDASWKTVPEYALVQFLLVAFPEEFFFRGFIQEALAKIWPPQTKILGAPFGLAAVITAAIFALSHSLIHLQWWHSFIFFPALLFGWLKEKTGTIWAGALFHAACNVFAYWVFLHYSR
jgi:membrane protease YdiL (CAAX protease family)